MIRFQPVSGSTYTEWQKTMCSSDEFSSYKLAAGKVLGEILFLAACRLQPHPGNFGVSGVQPLNRLI